MDIINGHQHELKIRSKMDTAAIRKITWYGITVNLLLTATKFIAGVFGRSQALVADAVHSLSDSATDLTVIVGSFFWSRPPDEEHPYGHQRIETIITISIGLVLALAATWLVANSLITMGNSHVSPNLLAASAALLSVVIKEIMYRWTLAIGNKTKSPAVQANAWHHRSDAISSIPALVAVVAASTFPDHGWIDHAGAIMVSLFIYHAAFTIIWPAFKELLEAGAPHQILDNIVQIALKENGVCQVHDLRSRYLAAGIAIDMHMIVEASLSVFEGHKISERVQQRIMEERDDVIDVLIHIEPTGIHE